MYRKDTAGQFITFQLVNASTGAALTGATVTVRRCLDGTFAAATGTVTEDATGATGWYKFAMSQADTNGNDCALQFTATSAVPVEKTFITTACDPTNSITFGIAALPATACTSNASLLTSGTGTDQIQVAAGLVSANTKQISGATQTAGDIMAAVSNIAVTGAALNTTAASATYTTGSDVGGYTNTFAADGTYDAVTSTAGSLDFYYQFSLGSTGQTAVTVDWLGYVAGVVNTIKAYAYNWGNTAYDQVGTVVGISGTANMSVAFDLTSAHTGTGGNLGLVRLRFAASGLTAAVVNTDRILCGYTVVTVFPTNFSSLSINGSGNVGSDLQTIKTQTVTAAAGVTFPSSIASPTNITAGTITTVTNQLTAAAIATGVWTDAVAGDFTAALSIGKSIMNGVSLGTGLTINTVTNQLTVSTIATGVWTDTKGTDFTAAGSIGQSLFTGVVPGASTGFLIAGSNAATAFATLTSTGAFSINGVSMVSQTGDSFARIGIAGVGLTNVVLPVGGLANVTAWTVNITGNLIGTVSTLTTYAGNTPQTGDSFARIGATGSGLISLAPSSTALSTANYTSARAGYLDNLNVGGAVASHADILAINQSASKHLLLTTVGQFEPGETYTVEMRTFAAADGSAVNADTTPTLTATGDVSGSLSANLSAATNPATGVYRWTYTPGATPTLEQIRFDGSATISSATFTLSAYSQTVDFATAVFTSTDQAHLTSIFNKLPANNIADETLILAAIGTPVQVGSNAGTTFASLTVSGSFTISDGLLVSRTTNNASAIVATGKGTGHGIQGISGTGATGDGFNGSAASTNGNGWAGAGAGNGNGWYGIGGGSGSGDGAHFTGGSGTNSVGIRAYGGASGGEGAYFAASTGNFAGVNIIGSGNACGLQSVGGSGGGSGAVFLGRGGASCGVQMLAADITAGYALYLQGNTADLQLHSGTTNMLLAKTTNISGFNDITAAAAATAVLTDTTDTGTVGSLGHVAITQLGGAFVGTGSVFTTPSLANAPTGGGTAPTVAQIDTQLSGTHGAGSWLTSPSAGNGAFTVTVTVNDGTNPLEGAIVRFTSGATTYSTATNASGIAVFTINAATWTVAIALSGYTFTQTTLAVGGNVNQTYGMTAVAITPSSAGETTGYLTAYDDVGVVKAGVVFTYTIIAISPAGPGLSFDTTAATATSDNSGLVQMPGMLIGATYKIHRGTTFGNVITATIPLTAGPTYQLPSVLGSP